MFISTCQVIVLLEYYWEFPAEIITRSPVDFMQSCVCVFCLGGIFFFVINNKSIFFLNIFFY